MTELEAEIVAFATQNLRRDIPSRVKKLGEEFGELVEAILNNKQGDALEEAADMGIILSDLVWLISSGTSTLSMEMAAKLTVVQSRRYQNGIRVREPDPLTTRPATEGRIIHKIIAAPAQCEKCGTVVQSPTTGLCQNDCLCGGTLVTVAFPQDPT